MKKHDCYPFKRQFHKMVKHTQTIRPQIANELFECVWPFVGLALKGLRRTLYCVTFAFFNLKV